MVSVTLSYYLKHFVMEAKYLTRFFWQTMESIHKFIIEFHPRALQCLLGNRGPFLHPQKKTLLSPSVWPSKEYTWTLIWKKSLLICSESCLGVAYSHRQSRIRMMNVFITVSITPICERQDKSMFGRSNKTSSFSLQLDQEENIYEHSFEIRAYWFILKATRVLPIPNTIERVWKTFCLCKR